MMNAEQRAHIKAILPCLDDALLVRFERAANLGLIVKAFETNINAAWREFVGEHLMNQSPSNSNDHLPKARFPDFGTPESSAPGTAPKPLLTEHQTAQTISPHSSHAHDSAGSGFPPPATPASAPEGTSLQNAINVQSGLVNATLSGASAAAPGTSPARPAIPPTAAAAPAKPSPAPDVSKAIPTAPAIRFTIRNARQNEPYDGEIVHDPVMKGLRLLDVTLPEDAALEVNLENWHISGTPAVAGEFTLGLRYTFADQPPHVSYTTGLQFVINADPKTLWQDKASDRSAPFWKEDSSSSVYLGQHAKMIAARKRGRSHAHKGTCCDDDYFLHCDDANGWYLAVVADGAGSAKFSRRGSQIATRAVGTYLKEVFSDERGTGLADAIEAFAQAGTAGVTAEELAVLQLKTRNELFKTLGYAAHHAVREIQNETQRRADVIASSKELSTTLLIGLARKIGTKWFCAAYWVGDGAVAVYRRNKSVHLLGVPDSGEFSGQTHFLDASQVSQEALLRRLRFELVEDMTALLLMTDGVSDPKFRSEAAMGCVEDWDHLWDDLDAEVRMSSEKDGHEVRLLEWLDFWAQGEYDDRTLAIIY